MRWGRVSWSQSGKDATKISTHDFKQCTVNIYKYKTTLNKSILSNTSSDMQRAPKLCV